MCGTGAPPVRAVAGTRPWPRCRHEHRRVQACQSGVELCNRACRSPWSLARACAAYGPGLAQRAQRLGDLRARPRMPAPVREHRTGLQVAISVARVGPTVTSAASHPSLMEEDATKTT